MLSGGQGGEGDCEQNEEEAIGKHVKINFRRAEAVKLGTDYCETIRLSES
jgi:hypothetical protein